MKKHLFIVLILGFSSGLPLPLVSSTLQAWYAESGMSIMVTGMLSLIGLPFILRTLWGPLLDRYSLTAFGKRRSWMLCMQAILLIGFNAMAWFTPNQHPLLLSILGLLLAACSATQDMAIEAHRVEYLPESEYALGTSFAVLGYRLALLFSGGIALIMAQHMGWSIAYRLMGLMMILGMFASILSPEPSLPALKKETVANQFIMPMKELFSRPRIIPLMLFIVFYKLGEAFTTTTSGIVMPFLIQGLGFSLETIGYVNKMMGIGAILVGGLIAGLLMLRWSIVRALMVFGLLQACSNMLFVALAITGKNLLLFSIAVCMDNFAAGMGSTALVALLMRMANRRFTATQFSFLAALSTLPRVFSGPIAASLQAWFGWVGLYEISVILALVFLPFLWMLQKSDHVGWAVRPDLITPHPSPLSSGERGQ